MQWAHFKIRRLMLSIQNCSLLASMLRALAAALGIEAGSSIGGFEACDMYSHACGSLV
jgi:hypothetical protein